MSSHTQARIAVGAHVVGHLSAFYTREFMYLTFETPQLMADCLAQRVDGFTDRENLQFHRLLADLDAAPNIAAMPIGVSHNESSESRVVFLIDPGLILTGRVDHVAKQETFVTAWQSRNRLLITGIERVRSS